MKYATAAAILAFVAYNASATPINAGAPPDELKPVPTGLNGRPDAIGKREPIAEIPGLPADAQLPVPTGPNGFPLAIGRRENIERRKGGKGIGKPKTAQPAATNKASAKANPTQQSQPNPVVTPRQSQAAPIVTPRNAVNQKRHSKPTPIAPAQEVHDKRHNVPTPIVVPGQEVNMARRGGVNGGGYINPGEPIGTFQPVIQRGDDVYERQADINEFPPPTGTAYLGALEARDDDSLNARIVAPEGPIAPRPTSINLNGPIGPIKAEAGGVDRRQDSNALLPGDNINSFPGPYEAPPTQPEPTFIHGLNKDVRRDSVNGGGYIPTEPIGTLVPVIQRAAVAGGLNEPEQPEEPSFGEPKIVC